MKDNLKEAIKDALVKCNIENSDIIIEVPKDNKNGDYSSNIAMQLARSLKKNPREIAEDIKNNIEFDKIDKIEIAGPGFLNFYLKKDYLFENINKVILEGDNYGSSNIGNGKRVKIEYVSANPTGFLHVGHARGAAYGDSLANILKFSGSSIGKFNSGIVSVPSNSLFRASDKFYYLYTRNSFFQFLYFLLFLYFFYFLHY